MPKTKISEYSATANSNTDVASINIDEGCAPSGINNAIRAVMGHLKDFQQGTNGDPFNGPVNGTLGATTASTANVTTLTTSSTVTHNGGTANGVAYLNGSKVLTTGSALVFDGSNLGVGVTPPTSTDAGNITIKGGSTLNFSTASGNMAANATFNSGWKYIATAAAVKYTQSGAEHQWFNAASGTAGNTISFTQAMTLDSGGKLLLGVTSGTGLSNGDFAMGNGNHIRFRNAANSAYISAFEFTSANGLNIGTGGSLSTITFGISGIGEAGRFDASANLLVGTTTGASSTSALMQLKKGGVQWDTGPNGSNGGFNVLKDGTTGVYLTSGATSWSGLSDETMKDIIEPIENASQKISTLRTVIGKYKTDEEGTRRAFLIAQDVEKVLPEAVNENENGKLGLQYTDVIPLMVAAIKEQQALITQLQADVASLKGA